MCVARLLLPRSSSYQAINSNQSTHTTQFKPVDIPINSIQTNQSKLVNIPNTNQSNSYSTHNKQEHFGAPLSHFVLPRAFPSTPIALCASAVDCHCECLRARFGHPYRTFALVCFTLARAKGISVHPYRTLCVREHFRAPLSHFAPL